MDILDLREEIRLLDRQQTIIKLSIATASVVPVALLYYRFFILS